MRRITALLRIRDEVAWLIWSSTHLLNWLIGLFFVIASEFSQFSQPEPVTAPPPALNLEWMIVQGLVIWGVLAAVQVYVLYRYMRRFSWWQPVWFATGGLGWMAFWVVLRMVALGTQDDFWLQAVTVPATLAVGVLQWVALRPLLTGIDWKRSAAWVGFHLLFGAALWYVVPLLSIFGFFLAGALYGLATGYMLDTHIADAQ